MDDEELGPAMSVILLFTSGWLDWQAFKAAQQRNNWS